MSLSETVDISSWDTFDEWGTNAFLLQSPEALSGYSTQGGAANPEETILYWLLGGYDTDNSTNIQERLEFVQFWAEYVKTHSDEEWSAQQNVLIDSQFV